MLSTRK